MEIGEIRKADYVLGVFLADDRDHRIVNRGPVQHPSYVAQPLLRALLDRKARLGIIAQDDDGGYALTHKRNQLRGEISRSLIELLDNNIKARGLHFRHEKLES